MEIQTKFAPIILDNMKTLSIIAAFSETGKLPEYVKYYCEHLLRISSEVCLVSNSPLSRVDRQYCLSKKITLIERRNQGYDFGAWKEAILTYGRERLKKFEHLILTNDSVFGPIFPLSKIIAPMQNKDSLDLWGVTTHPSSKIDDCQEHLQSYFLCFNHRILSSKEFFEYWEEVAAPNSYSEAVSLEKRLTQYFHRLGYNYGAFLSGENITSVKLDMQNSTIFDPIKLLKKGNPFVKRRLFTFSHKQSSDLGIYDLPSRLFQWLSLNSDYPISLIDDYLIQKLPPSELKRIYLLNFVGSQQENRSASASEKKVALILHVFFPDLINECCRYVHSMMSSDKIVIVSSSQDLLSEYTRRLKDDYPLLETRHQLNRGRNEAAYFVTCKDILQEYDFICLAHDKKLKHLPGNIGRKAFEHCFENCLGSKSQVNSILNIFIKNPRLGLLTPPLPNSSAWRDLDLYPYGINKTGCIRLASKYLKNIPFDEAPLSPIGTVFWMRKDSLNSLLSLNLTQSDFPLEPLPLDGSLLHQMERLYPSFAQKSGFLTGWCLSPFQSRLYIEETYFMFKERSSFLKLKVAIKKKLKVLIHSHPLMHNFVSRICKKKSGK